MKTVTGALLWITAMLIAVAVLYRSARGRPVLLHGRHSPRLIRMVALILLVVGVGGDETRAQVPAPQKPVNNETVPLAAMPLLPAWLTIERISRWRRINGIRRSGWPRLKDELTRYEQEPEAAQAVRRARSSSPKAFRALIDRELDQGGPHLIQDPALLLDALDDLEKNGFIDGWIAGYLFRRTKHIPAAQLPELLGRIFDHAKVANTLILGNAQIKPVPYSPRAWMSKAGPSRSVRAAERQAVSELFEHAKRSFGQANAGTWERDATVALQVVSGEVTIMRGTTRITMGENETFRMGRLDVLETKTDAVVKHGWLGELPIPSGAYSAFTFAATLNDEALEKGRAAVQRALHADEDAMAQLESTLLLTHALIKAGVQESPDAKGAPGLRTILALFEE